MHIEEERAKALCEFVSERVAGWDPPVEVTVSGLGMHWECIARISSIRCRMECFENADAGYLVSFERGPEIVARGSTASKTDLLAAVDTWLKDSNLTVLYAQFGFVDRVKRALTELRNSVHTRVPTMAEGSMVHAHRNSWRLSYQSDDRSCDVSHFRKDGFPDAIFYWDGSPMFEFPVDDAGYFPEVLKRWVGDRAMPSELRREFDGIKIDVVADYYEQGNGVEGEFLRSWDDAQSLYRVLQWPFAPDAVRVIEEIRSRGYDRTLRAGTSLADLILSRSRRHGLRRDQPYIVFSFNPRGVDINFHMVTGQSVLTFPAIALNRPIIALLDDLSARPID